MNNSFTLKNKKNILNFNNIKMLNRSQIMSNSTTNNQNTTLTLPITCQICLSRVRDPCVCPNLHAFCKCCIDMWLEKSKQCPTCRTSQF